MFGSVVWGLFTAEAAWAKVATLGVQGNLTNKTLTVRGCITPVFFFHIKRDFNLHYCTYLISWLWMCSIYSIPLRHRQTYTPAAAAAAAAICAVLPLLWNGLVGAAAGAATNGLVDWPVGERYQVTKQVQSVRPKHVKNKSIESWRTQHYLPHSHEGTKVVNCKIHTTESSYNYL